MPAAPMRKDAVLASIQRGYIGDLTASRKVRVFDIPFEEAYSMIKRGEKPPEHMANSIYLEWFSEANGRVVIESTDFELEISAPEWRMTAEDERQRVDDASAGWRAFLGKLDNAVELHQRNAKDPEEEWDEHDYERFLKESDARTDKYMELLDKYGHTDEAHEKIAEEMGWNRELTDEEAEAQRERIEELNANCDAALNEPPPELDPSREGIDWIRTAEGEIRHPLQHRCWESALNLWRRCEELGFNKREDDNLDQFIFEFQTASVKLAGALSGIAEGYEPHDPAFTVAYLKRALDHLHKAQAGLEATVEKQSQSPSSELRLPDSLITEARQEMFEVREGILRLMQQFRDRK